jgi:hypothetical protein
VGQCPRCRNGQWFVEYSAWKDSHNRPPPLVSVFPAKKTTWFEFCWVPLLPVHWQHLWVCHICSWQEKKQKEYVFFVSAPCVDGRLTCPQRLDFLWVSRRTRCIGCSVGGIRCSQCAGISTYVHSRSGILPYECERENLKLLVPRIRDPEIFYC